jgi:hypothetical protein
MYSRNHKKLQKRYKKKTILKLYGLYANVSLILEELPTVLKEIVISYIHTDGNTYYRVDHPIYQKRQCITLIKSVNVEQLANLKKENINEITRCLIEGICFNSKSLNITFDEIHKIYPNFYIKNSKKLMKHVRAILLKEKNTYGSYMGIKHHCGETGYVLD